ncbi:biotin--[acetyl-CoA-carboxylase] ligase [Hyphomonas sp.]|uniref:biotin--[acetyl-CoA-carboxylase] ligase n=1 Tax=Hyphomonas sp. TaxID=87 RepID=UPI00391BBEF9
MSADWPVFRFDQIDSTNTEAKRRAATGRFEDQWLVAGQQSAGRGRQGKAWLSPLGNLYATALFSEPGGIPVALRIPFAAALAVSDTLTRFAGTAGIQLKWPNDVRADGQKVSGILVETGGGDPVHWIAAGIGINVSAMPDNPGQPATTLSALCGQPVDVNAVFETLRASFAARLLQARTGFESLRTDWLARAEGLGQAVSVRTGDQAVEGVFEDMEADGGLRLRLPDGSARIIRAGEVNLLGRS